MSVVPTPALTRLTPSNHSQSPYPFSSFSLSLSTPPLLRGHQKKVPEDHPVDVIAQAIAERTLLLAVWSHLVWPHLLTAFTTPLHSICTAEAPTLRTVELSGNTFDLDACKVRVLPTLAHHGHHYNSHGAHLSAPLLSARHDTSCSSSSRAPPLSPLSPRHGLFCVGLVSHTHTACTICERMCEESVVSALGRLPFQGPCICLRTWDAWRAVPCASCLLGDWCYRRRGFLVLRCCLSTRTASRCWSAGDLWVGVCRRSPRLCNDAKI